MRADLRPRHPDHRAAIRAAVARALVVCVALTGSGPAAAQVARTFVATTGSDANAAASCSRSSPCRSFDAALAVTQAGGEVVVLDSGGYGPAVITKRVTLSAPSGVHAAITQALPGRPAIRVDTADSVVIRGLVLLGANAGSVGVLVQAATDVTVERCVIEGFREAGLRLQPAAPGSFGGTLTVQETTVQANAVGMQADGPGRVSLQDSRVEGNLVGLVVRHAAATVSRSVIAGNLFEGVLLSEPDARASLVDTAIAQNRRGVAVDEGEAALVRCAVDDHTAEGVDVAAGARAVVEDCTLGGNATGLEVEGTALIAASVVAGNQVGLKNDGGRIETRRDNTVTGNGANVVGALTAVGGR
jgi:hypothetical protein